MLKWSSPHGPILPVSHRGGEVLGFQAASAPSAQRGEGKKDFGAEITPT